ncbi:DNA-protecting protein DprA [Candidatus Giovannonibacteria bacterium]|nr:DNA-protecting protein DprA [Candidatus Giovannonibacteria bacterium]
MVREIKELIPEDKDFPALLREIPHVPKKISIWGKFPKTKYYLSVVGTRKNSAYGEEILRKIIAGLVPYNFTIVSGLALGIDTVAHRASLENKMPTVAVLGSGLGEKVLYPQNNLKLAEEIASRGGAVISEYENNFQATLWSFPQRNRIISGLSPATLVVEAPKKSGSLITARFALDQNRDVLAVPGSPFSPNAAGTNFLIKSGAALVESAEDVLKAYGLETMSEPGIEPELSAPEKQIFEYLTEPTDMDSIIRKSKMKPSDIQAMVGLMEIRGIIKKIGSEYVRA